MFMGFFVLLHQAVWDPTSPCCSALGGRPAENPEEIPGVGLGLWGLQGIWWRDGWRSRKEKVAD